MTAKNTALSHLVGVVHTNPASKGRNLVLQQLRRKGGQLLRLTCITKVARLHPVSGVIAAALCFTVSLADSWGGTQQPVLGGNS